MSDDNRLDDDDNRDDPPAPSMSAVDVLAGLWASDDAHMILNYESQEIEENGGLRGLAYTDRRFRTRTRQNVADWYLHMSDDQHLKILREGFMDLCERGTEKQMESFLREHPAFDPHFDNETGFVKACMENTRDMVEYLYRRITPDISANHDEAFRFACLMNRIEVAYFLQDIIPRYEFSLRQRNPGDIQEPSESDAFADYVIDNNTVQIDKYQARAKAERENALNRIDELELSTTEEIEYEIDPREDNEEFSEY